MKRGFTLIDVIVLLIIIVILGLISTIIVVGVINNMKKDTDKILIDNYVNSFLYAKELFMKDNDNIIPKYCSIKNDIFYYDENYNDIYDSNELICNKECSDNSCIKYFITMDDINATDKDVKCNKIIINDDGNIEISNCFIRNRKVKNYSYSTSNQESSVE